MTPSSLSAQGCILLVDMIISVPQGVVAEDHTEIEIKQNGTYYLTSKPLC